MKPALRDIDQCCYDFDGVFYPLLTIPDIKEICANIWAETFCAVSGTSELFKEAKHKALTGFEEYGDSLLALEQWAIEKGIEKQDLRQTLFNTFFQHYTTKMQEIIPHELAPDAKTIEAFEECSHIRKGIASHASIEFWIAPSLKSMKLSNHFNPEAMFGLDDGDFVLKSIHPTLIEKCFNALGDGEQRSYIEDSPKNLSVTKECIPTTATILIHHGHNFRHLPTYIDYQFKNLPEMKRALNRARSEKRKTIVELRPV